MVPKSHSKTGLKNDRLLIDFGVPFGVQNGVQNGLKTDLGSSRVPECPRGRFWKDFRPFVELFWDDFLKVVRRISMLGLIVFKVFASSFLRRWWEISLCCFHPFGYDLGVVWYVVRHVFSYVY